MVELARRLVAHPRWTWRPGAKAVGRRGLPAAWFRVEEPVGRLSGEWADAVPDLADAATAGVLLGMLGRPTTIPCGWVLDWHRGGTLGEAAARALLSAWGPA